MMFEAGKGMHAQFYRTGEMARSKEMAGSTRKQQAASFFRRRESLPRARGHGNPALLNAAADMGISPYLLYYRASFAPTCSRNPNEKGVVRPQPVTEPK